MRRRCVFFHPDRLLAGLEMNTASRRDLKCAKRCTSGDTTLPGSFWARQAEGLSNQTAAFFIFIISDVHPIHKRSPRALCQTDVRDKRGTLAIFSIWCARQSSQALAIKFLVCVCLCVVHRWNDIIEAGCNALSRNHKINSAVLWRQERARNAWNIQHLNVKTYAKI